MNHPRRQFGGDPHLFPVAAGKDTTQDGFGLTGMIGPGRVQVVDPTVDGVVHRSDGNAAALDRDSATISRLDSETGQVFTLYVRLLQLRRQQPAFHPDAAQQIHELDERVFCFERTAVNAKQRILVLANLSAEHVSLDLDALPDDLSRRDELLGLNPPQFGPTTLRVEPYAVFWFSR